MSLNEELQLLFEKYQNEDLSPQERTRFLDLLREEDNQQQLADSIGDILNRPLQAGPGLDTLEKQQIFENVLREAAGRERTRRFPFVRYAAAAAVMILLAGTAWFFIAKKKAPLHADTPLAKTSSPLGSHPGNQVLLTLADGTQVPLDSVKEGLLSEGQKQGADIVKTGKGEIEYKVNKDPGAGAVMSYNTITTPRGGQYHIILPDNTQVWLNAASSLKFPLSFSGHDRNVVLSGEAYFEVAKETSKPFTVSISTQMDAKKKDMKIEVLGTHFNVMAYEDETAVRTTLLEGSVRLRNENDHVVLKPGQQGSLTPESNAFRLSTPNMEEVMAWKNGEFRFDNTPVATIMRQIARWYGLTVEYNGNMSDLTLSGVIARKEEVSQLLDILEATHKVRFKMEGEKLIVMPN